MEKQTQKQIEDNYLGSNKDARASWEFYHRLSRTGVVVHPYDYDCEDWCDGEGGCDKCDLVLPMWSHFVKFDEWEEREREALTTHERVLLMKKIKDFINSALSSEAIVGYIESSGSRQYSQLEWSQFRKEADAKSNYGQEPLRSNEVKTTSHYNGDSDHFAIILGGEYLLYRYTRRLNGSTYTYKVLDQDVDEETYHVMADWANIFLSQKKGEFRNAWSHYDRAIRPISKRPQTTRGDW